MTDDAQLRKLIRQVEDLVTDTKAAFDERLARIDADRTDLRHVCDHHGEAITAVTEQVAQVAEVVTQLVEDLPGTVADAVTTTVDPAGG